MKLRWIAVFLILFTAAWLPIIAQRLRLRRLPHTRTSLQNPISPLQVVAMARTVAPNPCPAVKAKMSRTCPGAIKTRWTSKPQPPAATVRTVRPAAPRTPRTLPTAARAKMQNSAPKMVRIAAPDPSASLAAAKTPPSPTPIPPRKPAAPTRTIPAATARPTPKIANPRPIHTKKGSSASAGALLASIFRFPVLIS